MCERVRYHHGDLRSALLGAARELIRERGARGFSVSEAARRAGVSASAPYRHFADRDAMIAAVAETSFAGLRESFSQLELAPEFGLRAVQIVVAYVEYAESDPAGFESMFAGGLDKNDYPELLREAERVQERLENAFALFLPATVVRGRAAELWALAHGVAALSVSGNLEHVVRRNLHLELAASAARAWVAGVLPVTQ